jgi:hypothetical protein
MKPVFVINRVIKAISVTTAAVLLIIGRPAVSHASPVKGKEVGHVSEEKVSVQYKGSDAANYLFRVEFENAAAQKFSLIIKNDEGVTVFQQQYENVHFATTVLLPKEEVDIHPTFIIHTANGDIKRSFSVSRKITEDLVVTKL